MMTPVRALIGADLRALNRDPMFRAMQVAPFALLGLLFVGVPLIGDWLDASYHVDLAPYRPAVAAMLLGVTIPLLFGAFAGLLFLEDRESGAWSMVAVSVVGRRPYIAVRCGWAAMSCAIATGGGLLLDGHPWMSTLATSVLAGGATAAIALLIGALATDRLEGMAITKAMTLPLALPLLLWPLGWPIGGILAFVPTFGPVAILHQADTGGGTAAAAAFSLLAVSHWIAILGRRFLHQPG